MRHSPSRLASRRGFSLTELLLVIILLAILIALLLPVASKARESAQATVCMQKLRQIGVGMVNYVQENRGALIPYASLGGSPQRFWFDELDQYMGEEPYQFNRSMPHKWQTCPAKPVIPVDRATVGYGWNHRYLGYTSSDKRGGPASMKQISKPSETVVIADSEDIDRNNPPAAASQNRYLYGHSEERLARRHSGKGFYLMLDWHILPATPAEIVEGGTGPYANFWVKKR